MWFQTIVSIAGLTPEGTHHVIQHLVAPLSSRRRHECGGSARAGVLQDRDDLAEAAPLRVRQRRDPLAIGQVDIRARFDQEPHDLGMARAAVAQDDRLQQRGPAQAIDVVDLDVGLQQLLDDLDMAAVGRADQAGAVVAVVLWTSAPACRVRFSSSR